MPQPFPPDGLGSERYLHSLPSSSYIPQDRSLVIDEGAARLVRDIFDLYLSLGCVRSLKLEVDRCGLMTPARTSQRSGQSGNRPFSRGHLYRILSNPIYIGQIAHKGKTYPGQHVPIIDRMIWEAAQAKLAENRQGHKQRGKAQSPSLLAGLLWDEQGNRLTPSHSKKGNRRYRYYVSDSLIQSSRDQAPDALRIPAHELEHAVINGLVEFLRQDTDILTLLDERGITDAHQLHAILKRAHALAKQFDGQECVTLDHRQSLASPAPVLTGSAWLIDLSQALIQRIIVGADHLQISVRLNVMLPDEGDRLNEGDGLDRSNPDQSDEAFVMPGCAVSAMPRSAIHGKPDSTLVAGPVDNDQDVHTIVLPMNLRRSGLAMRLIVPGHEVYRGPDPRLVQLLVKAHDWFDRLRSGKARSMLAIAKEQEITSSYVTRVIYLAFLAPDIVKAILQGQQPDTLTSDSLMRSVPLPIDWTEQKKLLGFVS